MGSLLKCGSHKSSVQLFWTLLVASCHGCVSSQQTNGFFLSLAVPPDVNCTMVMKKGDRAKLKVKFSGQPQPRLFLEIAGNNQTLKTAQLDFFVDYPIEGKSVNGRKVEIYLGKQTAHALMLDVPSNASLWYMTITAKNAFGEAKKTFEVVKGRSKHRMLMIIYQIFLWEILSLSLLGTVSFLVASPLI